MKKIVSLSFFLFASLKLFSQTQVVDLRTGIDDITQGSISYGNFDDTWEVKLPGSSTFQPSYVVSTSYFSSNVDYISPFSTTPYNGLGGSYVYRMTFESELGPCGLATDVLLYFNFIAGDDVVQSVSLNGNTPHTVNAGFTQSPPTTLPLLIQNMGINIPVSELVLGTNTVEFVVNNWVDQFFVITPTVLNCDAYLKIDYQTTVPMQANFNFTATQPFCSSGSMIFDATSSTGPIADHSWVVLECDQFGNAIPGATAYIGNWSPGAPGMFNLTAVWPTMACGKYYNIQLKVKDQCGNVYVSAIEKFFWACAPPIFLTGSTSEICYGGTGYIYLGTSMFGNYNATVSPFPYAGTIYNGPANTIVPINPTGNTTYQITMTDLSTGCSSVAYWNTTIVYNSFPINLQGSTSSVCNGGSGYISTTVQGGNPANYLVTIYEQPGNNVVYTGPLAAVMVTPPGNAPSTTYFIQVEDQVTGCISTTTWTIEINNTPFPIDLVGSHTVCPGNSTMINLSLPGGLSGYTMSVYAFTGGSFAPQIYSGPATSLSVSPSVNTNYTFHITNTLTGCTSVANFQVNVVNNFTTFTAASIQCIGGGILVNGSASTGPFSSHVWSLIKCTSAGVPIPGSPVISVFGTGQPGIHVFTAGAANLQCNNYYRIRLNTTDICGMQNPTVVQAVVFVKCCPPPVQGPATDDTNPGNTVTVVYNNPEEFDALYQQFRDNGLVTNTNLSYMDEVSENQLSVYPNPTAAETIVNYTIRENTSGKIVVTDLSGRIIETVEVVAEEHSIRFDFSAYESGIYFVNLFEDDQLVKTEKLVRNN